MPHILSTVAHRPYPLPAGDWRMTQRWSDLLFAHWPLVPDAIARLLPAGLEVDTFDNYAWVGVVPFWMDRVRTRTFGEHSLSIPSTADFCELNLRTYVRSRATGLHGVFFFSLDAASALAVLGARTLFHLPYFLASMERRRESDGSIHYRSRRLFTHRSIRFEATYRSLRKRSFVQSKTQATPQTSAAMTSPSAPGTLEHFLTERYCLFTPHAGRTLIGHIHHLPWPLETAEAEIRLNELPSAHGITLPNRAPVLHFARELQVFLWALREEG